MNKSFPFTQIRVARPTQKLSKIIGFYCEGLGLKIIGRFENHEGISGIMLGMPDETYHLEFTEHSNNQPCPPPTKDNLLVFYFRDTAERDRIGEKLLKLGYPVVEPENPYWNKNGITVEDPDKWRIVLMDIPGFRIEKE